MGTLLYIVPLKSGGLTVVHGPDKAGAFSTMSKPGALEELPR